MVTQNPPEVEVAEIRNDDSDGLYIIGVVSTGIYCLPSCRAKKPNPENVRIFRSIESAAEAGLRPCLKCRPNDFYAGVDRDLEEIESSVAQLRREPKDIQTISDFAKVAGVGVTKLFASVRRHFQTTPGELITRHRIEAARMRLLESTVGVSEIAIDVGYEAQSSFYDQFGRLNGLTPLAYRKLLTTKSFSVSLPDGFRWDAVLSYLGRDPESLSERVECGALTVTTTLGEVPTILRLCHIGNAVTCEVNGGSAVEAHRCVVRVLGLAQDVSGFESFAARIGHSRIYSGRKGLRMPLTLQPFDGVIWSILGQQVNLGFAYTLRRRLIALTGTQLGDRLFSPPQPTDIARLDVEDLLPLQFSRRKAEYLIGIARRIVHRELELEAMQFASATRTEKALSDIRGFGPWSVNYLMMRALGFGDCVPIGDTGLSTALQRYFELDVRPDARTTKAIMQQFSPYRSQATFHLWQSLKIES